MYIKRKINSFLNQQKELFGNEIFTYSLNKSIIKKTSLYSESYAIEHLENYENSISLCQKCSLGKTRNNFVFGSGDHNADLMLVGDVPGVNEDNQGVPFIGKEGKLLDRILSAIGKNRRSDVYLANVLKCYIPQNRNPLLSEISKCKAYLFKQIEFINPKVILALGRISGRVLLNIDLPLEKLRENIHDYKGIPVRVTYHPAALLRNPDFKKETWKDFKWATTFLKN